MSEHNPKHNATAVKIKDGKKFKDWLETIEPEYRESVTSHRRTYIAILLGSRQGGPMVGRQRNDRG